jgi:hypothetical protein
MKSIPLAIMVAFCMTGCAAQDPPKDEEPSSTGTVTQAATNDGFTVTTTDGCGSAEFVDSGTLNGETNDDFVLVHDLCGDGHSVRASAVLIDSLGNTFGLGSIRNSSGLAGAPVGWDPFASIGDVLPGDTMIFQVCLVDGADDSNPSNCRVGSKVSSDG